MTLSLLLSSWFALYFASCWQALPCWSAFFVSTSGDNPQDFPNIFSKGSLFIAILSTNRSPSHILDMLIHEFSFSFFTEFYQLFEIWFDFYFFIDDNSVNNRPEFKLEVIIIDKLHVRYVDDLACGVCLFLCLHRPQWSLLWSEHGQPRTPHKSCTADA